MILFSRSLFDNNVSTAFAVSMTLVFFIILVGLTNRKLSGKGIFSFFSRLHRSNRNLLMNVGIFGTFAGICMSLLHFNPSNIDASVPALLEGMKLAFSTSVLGVFFSVVLSFAGTASPAPEAPASPIEALIKGIEESRRDIVAELQRISEDGRAFASEQIHRNERTIEAVEALQRSIVGDADTSLATRLLHIRQEAIDGRKEIKSLLTESFTDIRRELADFGKTLAESNSKALLEALRDIIRDFNNQLTEQFGENFKELNKAVGSLLEWQENYRQSVERMQEEFSRCLDGVQVCEKSLVSIRTEAEAIPSAMHALSILMKGLEAQNREANALLESFSHMREKAGEALPLLEEKMRAITDELAKSFENVSRQVEETSSNLESAMSNVSRSMTDSTKLLTETLIESVERSTDDMVELAKRISDAMERGAETMRVSLKETLQQTLQQTQEIMKKQFSAFDSTMEQELRSAISQLGTHLTSLSGKFVEDYTPLTSRLAEVVRLAEKTPSSAYASKDSRR